MTSSTAPSGVASASSVYSSSFAAWYSFDNNVNTYWRSLSTVNNKWLQYQLTSQKTLTGYAITGYNSSHNPASWTLKGSNDGIGWITLDTQTGQNTDRGESIVFLGLTTIRTSNLII